MESTMKYQNLLAGALVLVLLLPELEEPEELEPELPVDLEPPELPEFEEPLNTSLRTLGALLVVRVLPLVP